MVQKNILKLHKWLATLIPQVRLNFKIHLPGPKDSLTGGGGEEEMGENLGF